MDLDLLAIGNSRWLSIAGHCERLLARTHAAGESGRARKRSLQGTTAEQMGQTRAPDASGDARDQARSGQIRQRPGINGSAEQNVNTYVCI